MFLLPPLFSVIMVSVLYVCTVSPAAVEDASTGKIILVFCKNNKKVFMMESSDDGATWGSVVDISGMVMEPTWGYVVTGPPGGIQLPSGRLIICRSICVHMSLKVQKTKLYQVGSVPMNYDVNTIK